jgi:MFS family permease
MGLSEIYRASPLGVVGTACAGLLSGALYGLGAIYAGDIGLSVLDVSLFMGAPILGGFLLQWPIGRLSDKFDRRSVLLAVLAATVGASLLLASVPKGGTELALPRVLIFLLGGAVSVIYPLTVSHAFDYIDRARMVAANSGMLLVWAIGATVGPLVGSVAMGQLGPSGLFAYMTSVATLLFGFTLWRMVRRVALPTGEQTTFVTVPATSAIAGALDPRTQQLPEFRYDDEDPGDR